MNMLYIKQFINRCFLSMFYMLGLCVGYISKPFLTGFSRGYFYYEMKPFIDKHNNNSEEPIEEPIEENQGEYDE